MRELQQREGFGVNALIFAILTAARSGEVRGATWAEINLDKAIWTIPASRMKGGKEHACRCPRRHWGSCARWRS
jgi:integrase